MAFAGKLAFSILCVLAEQAFLECGAAAVSSNHVEVSVDAAADVKVSHIRSERSGSQTAVVGEFDLSANLSSSNAEASAATCAPLTNHGTHFTVKLQVGTPGQSFSLVADTGSNAVIVTSCTCREKGKCKADLACFHGTGKSSTFVIKDTKAGTQSGPAMVSMRFGSGDIEAVIATDVVQIGSIQATMTDSLLLMIDQALHIDGGLEGILGLGPPSKQRESSKCHVDASGNAQSSEGRIAHLVRKKINVNSWLDQARVDRFSMCFKDGGDGVLRLGIPKPAQELDSI
eukprot:671747-Amphidinium_carterae.1